MSGLSILEFEISLEVILTFEIVFKDFLSGIFAAWR